MKITQSTIYSNKFMKLSIAINTQKDMEGEYTQSYNFRGEYDILTFNTKFYLKMMPTKLLVLPGDPSGKINIPSNTLSIFAASIERVYHSIEEHPEMYIRDARGNITMDKNMATELSKGFRVYDDRVIIRPDVVLDYEGNQVPAVTFWSGAGPAGGETVSELEQLAKLISDIDSGILSLLLLNMRQLQSIDDRVSSIDKSFKELMAMFNGIHEPIHLNGAENLPPPEFTGDSIWKN